MTKVLFNLSKWSAGCDARELELAIDPRDPSHRLTFAGFGQALSSPSPSFLGQLIQETRDIDN